VICAEYFDLKRTFRDVIENTLCIKWTIVVANAGMVATNNQVSRSHVLAEYRMQNRFTRTGVQHVKTVTGHHYAVLREVHVDHLADAGIADGSRNIAGFELAEQHVNGDTIGVQALHGHAAQFFVRQMHWIPRLEGNDLFPAARRDVIANFDCCLECARKLRFEVA